MARIYAKPISGGVFDNTLILDTREALVLPFDFSGDYSVVKMVAFVSMTSGEFDNASMMTPSTSAFNVSLPTNDNPRNKPYFGFINQDGFPGISGCAFLGFTTYSGESETRMRLGGLNENVLWGGSNFGGVSTCGFVDPTGGVYQSNTSRLRYQMSYSENHSGQNAYVSVMGIEISLSNPGTPSAVATMWKFNDNTNRAPNTGYSDLVAAAYPTAFNDSNGQSYTAPYQFSGQALPIPRYGFIYNPFADFKLRIHSVGIFRS